MFGHTRCMVYIAGVMSYTRTQTRMYFLFVLYWLLPYYLYVIRRGSVPFCVYVLHAPYCDSVNADNTHTYNFTGIVLSDNTCIIPA
jgi:hypothetical protein